jgi:nucleobase:cation symporter-1, NCS1 family
LLVSLFIALRLFVLLTYLWVPAWAAVLLVDFFVFRRGRYASDQLTRGRQGIYWYRGGVFWRAFIAWLVGVAVTIPFIGSATLPWMTQPWQDPLAHLLGGMDVTGIVGAVVSAVLYYVLGSRYFIQSVEKHNRAFFDKKERP